MGMLGFPSLGCAGPSGGVSHIEATSDSSRLSGQPQEAANLPAAGRIVNLSLTATEESESAGPEDSDPFAVRKLAMMVANPVIYPLAPRSIRRELEGEVRRSFGFAGHRTAFRKMNPGPASGGLCFG